MKPLADLKERSQNSHNTYGNEDLLVSVYETLSEMSVGTHAKSQNSQNHQMEGDENLDAVMENEEHQEAATNRV